MWDAQRASKKTAGGTAASVQPSRSFSKTSATTTGLQGMALRLMCVVLADHLRSGSLLSSASLA
jgi:hypothetical protein